MPILRLRAPAGRLRAGEAALLASRTVAALPPYQVALWPDGWELDPNGAVRVRDTHAMAEARRWYALADRGPGAQGTDRAMRLHGTYVPRPIVALSRHRFPSEAAASVAVQLVAGDWVVQRRRQLLAAPADALRERALAWTGSCHEVDLDADAVLARLQSVLDLCMREGLLPKTRYGLRVRTEDGFGLRVYRCLVTVRLDSDALVRAGEAIQAGLIPWNRAVVRRGAVHPVVKVEMRRCTPRDVLVR